MLWCALHENHPELTLEDAGEILGEAGMVETVDRISDALVAGLPRPKEGAGRPPAAGRSGTGRNS